MTGKCCDKQRGMPSRFVWKGYVRCSWCETMLEPAPKPKPEKPAKRRLGIS